MIYYTHVGMKLSVEPKQKQLLFTKQQLRAHFAFQVMLRVKGLGVGCGYESEGGGGACG